MPSVRNELEARLQALHDGEISDQSFMEALLESQVFMPVRDDAPVGGFQTSDKAIPLTLETEDGMTVLILFTSPDRAQPFLADFPDFRGGILVDMQWLLRRIGAGCGISINPGQEPGLDLEPDLVEGLIHVALQKQQ